MPEKAISNSHASSLFTRQMKLFATYSVTHTLLPLLHRELYLYWITHPSRLLGALSKRESVKYKAQKLKKCKQNGKNTIVIALMVFFFCAVCVIATTLYVFSKIKLTNPFYFLRRQIFNSISRLNSPFQVSAPANRQNVDK